MLFHKSKRTCATKNKTTKLTNKAQPSQKKHTQQITNKKHQNIFQETRSSSSSSSWETGSFHPSVSSSVSSSTSKAVAVLVGDSQDVGRPSSSLLRRLRGEAPAPDEQGAPWRSSSGARGQSVGAAQLVFFGAQMGELWDSVYQK